MTYHVGYPVTQNHVEAAAIVRRAAVAAVGESRVQWGCNPSMASEDFSFMLQACPGAYLWMGVDGDEPSAALHNPYYDFNDQVIEPAVAVWTQLVEQSLPAT